MELRFYAWLNLCIILKTQSVPKLEEKKIPNAFQAKQGSTASFYGESRGLTQTVTYSTIHTQYSHIRYLEVCLQGE